MTCFDEEPGTEKDYWESQKDYYESEEYLNSFPKEESDDQEEVRETDD